MSDQIQSSTPVDSNPWATDAATSAAPVATDSATQTLSAAADPWGASMAEGSRAAGSASHEVASQAVQSQAAQSTDWLNSAPAAAPEHFSLMDPFHNTWVPLDSWVTHGIDWVVLHFRPLFQGIRVPVDFILSGFQHLLLGMPAPVAILVFALIAWQFSTLGMGVATLVSLIAIGAIGAWSQAMVTLALVLTSLFFCILIGLP
ncbi:proline/betaine ABC transporter permease ProW, partial [Yersinia enterocolitica]